MMQDSHVSTDLDHNYYSQPTQPLDDVARFNSAEMFMIGRAASSDASFHVNSNDAPMDPLLYIPNDFDVSIPNVTSTSPTTIYTANNFMHNPFLADHKPKPDPDAFPTIDAAAGEIPGGRTSNELDDKDLTPAQTRRKAQNRAAQRAFRERKERHVRDLEIQLNNMTAKTTTLQTDVERLKVMLQRAQTENKILRASAATASVGDVSRRSSLEDQAPLMFSQSECSKRPSLVNSDSSATTSSSDSLSSLPVHRYLGPDAAWDLLQSHPLFQKGFVDVGQVCEKLKWLARCEASAGPVFDEVEVMQIIEEVAESLQDAPT